MTIERLRRRKEPWHRPPTGPTHNVQNAGTAARLRIGTQLTFLTSASNVTIEVLNADGGAVTSYALTANTARTESFLATQQVRVTLTGAPGVPLSFLTIRLGGTTGLVVAHVPVRG